MSNYLRVIPRDLFNEASLLKCYGRLWIKLDEKWGHAAEMRHDDQAFDVLQDASTGAIYVRNISLRVAGKRYLLTRPLNSRDDWPLYVESDDDRDFDPVDVFDDAGELSVTFLAFIGSAS